MTVFRDQFEQFPIGDLPFDYSAVGEYHSLDLPALPAGWADVTNHTSWGKLGNWQVVNDQGRKVMQQARLRAEGMPMLAAGDVRWRDVSVAAEVRLLSPHTEAGVMIRYANNRTHYSLRISGAGRVRLVRRKHEDKAVLAETTWEPEFQTYHRLRIEAAGDRLVAFLDDVRLFDITDDTLPSGAIGLLATGPARFARVEVDAGDPELDRLRTQHSRDVHDLEVLRHKYPRPVVWRKLETPEFGAGRHVRFGDVNGDGRLEILFAQHTQTLTGGDFCMLSCLTMMDLDGNVLWQWGEPHRHHGIVPSDMPVQIHDVNGDGKLEVVCCRDFEIHVLDGVSGELLHRAPTPEPGPMATWLPEDNLFRIPGDCVSFADLRGLGRRGDILVKDRYSNLTAYDEDLNRLWRFHGNTGHFPAVHDIDLDGRDEVMIGYALVDHDGALLWRIDVADHQDAIAIAPIDPDSSEPLIALACGEGGTVVCDAKGKIIWRDHTGHVQRLTAVQVREDAPGLQIITKTFWGNPDIICVYDARGNILDSIELPGGGAVLSPVNWTGKAPDLLLTSGSLRLGGLLDGRLRRVVEFPDDGHPTLCAEALDLTGDARDEIVLWDLDRMWVYTQDRPSQAPILRPTRQPHYNMSDYRAEISVYPPEK